MGTVDYERARTIQPEERDVELRLDDVRWPNERVVLPDWTLDGDYLTRTVQDDTGEDMTQPIKETLLRFPSAPLHGWQRLHESHVNRGESENFHTYRVFSHPKRTRRARRIFLMNNGLNETNTMGLYYRLASNLIEEDPTTVCVLRPFPGHFTRFRYQAFAETPLDRYLWDGSSLFRQFLRYMIETQWFLSAIVRRSTYRCVAGTSLLGEHDDPRRSRLMGDVLAREMQRAWEALREKSVEAVKTLHEKQGYAPRVKDPPEDKRMFDGAIDSLRTHMGLNPYRKLDGELRDGDEEPSLHVIGYSLGGFTAQSIFMSWPFLVSSCATLLSGGALRELSPTAFAHREEWQTVLRSLRYELDDAMMSELYGSDDGRVSGIEEELFLFLKRTFYEVFQQEYRGSFQSRLAAFRRRLLFVVGGNDPIVHTRSVLDSGPPGGINVLAVGGLGHFLDRKAQDEEEEQQRSFWLPEVGRLIDSFSKAARETQLKERPYTWLDYDMKVLKSPERGRKGDQSERESEKKVEVTRLNAPERLAIEGDGALPGELFERCLDDLLARQLDDGPQSGLLFVLRNEMPTMLLDDPRIYQNAAMLYHDDVSIACCVQGVRARREALLKHRKRNALILPWNARLIMKRMDLHKDYPTQAEDAKGKLPRPGCVAGGEWARTAVSSTGGSVETSVDTELENGEEEDDGWEEHFRVCEGLTEGDGQNSVRVFDGREAFKEPPKINKATLELLESRTCHKSLHPILGAPSSLPDCWVWMSRDYLNIKGKDGLTVKKGIEQLPHVVPASCESHEALEDYLRKDDLRIITVSRARYNPRFRGRIVADPAAAMNLLYHVALCMTSSVPLAEFDLSKPRSS